MAGRPAFRAMMSAPDGRARLAQYARLGRGIYERVGPLVPVVYGSGGDRGLRDFVETVEGERLRGTAALLSGSRASGG